MGKRGPTPKGEYVNKSKVLSTRIREDTREALSQAAKKSGRSLSQEIEHRLRRSFDFDGRVVEVFGDLKIYSLMRVVGAVMTAQFNPKNFNSWADDPYAFDQAVRAVNAVLEAIRPPGDPRAPDLKDWGSDAWTEMAARRGNEVAGKALREIASAADQLPTHVRDRAPFIKDGLGAIADRISGLASSEIIYRDAKTLREAADQLDRKAKSGGKK